MDSFNYLWTHPNVIRRRTQAVTGNIHKSAWNCEKILLSKSRVPQLNFGSPKKLRSTSDGNITILVEDDGSQVFARKYQKIQANVNISSYESWGWAAPRLPLDVAQVFFGILDSFIQFCLKEPFHSRTFKSSMKKESTIDGYPVRSS